MSTHPYIPLYVDDFEAATAHLSPEEDGVYNRLLRLCWRTPGCGLPNDPAWIARKIRVSADDFERLVQPILSEFFGLQRGRFVQRRLKREYDYISRKKIARKVAGKKGGEAKALKNKEKDLSNASDLPPHAHAFHTQNHIHTQKEGSEDKSSGADGAEPDLDAQTWRSAVSVLTDQGGMPEPAARRFFGKLLSANGLSAKELLPALSGALVKQTQDPRAYLTRAAEGIAKRRAATVEPKRQEWV